MKAERLGRPDGSEEIWKIQGSNGCCMLTVHLLSGVAVVEGSGWCLSCLHEAQAFARDRGYRMQRLVPFDSQARL